MTTFQLPQLKINNFRKQLARPEIDEFKTENINGTTIYLTVHEDGNGKVAVIHTRFQTIGWTENMDIAFNFFHNCSIYTLEEMYNIARGKKIV